MEVRATLGEPAVAIPGDVTTCRIALRNDTDADDQLRFEVEGEASAWASVQPATLDVAAGADGVADIIVSVPRSFRLGPGAVALEVRVRSRNQPAHQVLARGLLRIGAFRDVTARLEPAISNARRSAPHIVTIHNGGNVPSRAAISATAPGRGVTAGLDGASLTAGPGLSATAIVGIRCRRPRVWGPRRVHPFAVVVTPEGARPITLVGELHQLPLVGGLRVALAVGAAIALSVLVVLVALILG